MVGCGIDRSGIIIIPYDDDALGMAMLRILEADFHLYAYGQPVQVPGTVPGARCRD